jgi:hypothetical protein
MRAPWRKTFDPERDFTVRRPITVGGQKFAPGDAFDKTLVTLRRLRQLYDQRTLHFVGDAPGKRLVPERARRKAKTEALTPIPADWATLPWMARRALVHDVAGIWPKNGEEAEAAVAAELHRRGTA